MGRIDVFCGAHRQLVRDVHDYRQVVLGRAPYTGHFGTAEQVPGGHLGFHREWFDLVGDDGSLCGLLGVGLCKYCLIGPMTRTLD